MTMTKVLHFFAFLSLCVAAVMVFQAVRQEFTLRDLRAHMTESMLGVKQKEQAIVEVKMKLQEMSKQLQPFNSKKEELSNKKRATADAIEEHDKNLQMCNTVKGGFERKKIENTEASTKLKAEHEEAKHKAQADIQSLKQAILDRDKAICAFVNESEEGRKLCGITDAKN